MRRIATVSAGNRAPPELKLLPRTKIVSFKKIGGNVVVTLATDLSAVGLLIEIKRLPSGRRISLLDYGGQRPRGAWF
jgi:hypothetical protein